MRNRALDLQILHCRALPLNCRELYGDRGYYKVHTTGVSHTARISSVERVGWVNRITKKVMYQGEMTELKTCRPSKGGFSPCFTAVMVS